MAHKKNNKDDDNLPKALQKHNNRKKDIEIKKSRQRKKTRKTKKRLRKIMLIVFIIIILIIGILLGISAHRWKTLAQEMLLNENSIVLDIDGNEIAHLGCERKNKTISLSSMPEYLKNAYVAIEDERFYSHKGIDMKRTGRCYPILSCSFWKIFLWGKYHYTTTSKKFNRRFNR